MRITAAANASSPRPTRVTARCSNTPRMSRWSPISKPITLTSSAAPRPTARVFDEFVARLRPGGSLVVCVDDPGAAALADRAAANGVDVLRYGSADGGSGDADLAAGLVNWEHQGTGSVSTVQLRGESKPRGLRLAVPGRHMALNAVAALLAAVQAGCGRDDGSRRSRRIRRCSTSIRVSGDGSGGPRLRRLRPPSD